MLCNTVKCVAALGWLGARQLSLPSTRAKRSHETALRITVTPLGSVRPRSAVLQSSSTPDPHPFTHHPRALMAIVACRSSVPRNAYKYPARLRKSAVRASFPSPFFGSGCRIVSDGECGDSRRFWRLPLAQCRQTPRDIASARSATRQG